MATNLNAPVLPPGRVLPVIRRNPQEERDRPRQQREQPPPDTPPHTAQPENTSAPRPRVTTPATATPDQNSHQSGSVIDDYV